MTNIVKIRASVFIPMSWTAIGWTGPKEDKQRET